MHQVWIHEDVIHSAEESTTLRRRLHIVIGQLAAFGRTTVTKSCGYPNRQWRRTPMGGNRGMHLYLWWRHLPQRMLPPDAPLGSVWLRAIRQHDDHSPLDHQNPSSDYLPFTREDLRNPQRAIALEPWTESQQDFINSPATIKTIRGQPGTGKTNALWHALTSAEPAHPIYLSRSADLTQQADQYLTAVLPESASPLFLPFDDFVSLINGEPAPDTTRQQSLEHFEQSLRLAHVNRRTAGPWLSRIEMLYDELHGHMLGSAIPGTPETRYTDPRQDRPRMARLTKLRYLERRAPVVGPESAAAATAIMTAVSEHPDARMSFHQAFPHLVAANKAVRRLRTGSTPDTLQPTDYIAVDEAQDLTLLQVYAILAAAAAIGRTGPATPTIVIAGDDSQTIQPSGFQWSDLTALVRLTGATPQDHVLLDPVRAPARVAQTLNRLNSLYTLIGRDIRPSTHQAPPPGDATTGATIVAAVPEDAIASFTTRLAELPDTFIISVADPPPSWLPAVAKQNLLTPEQVKGLEQANVAIIGAAAVLDTILQPDHGRRYPQLDAISIRSHIDRLRVAASRTSQNLVFIERPEDAQRLAQQLEETPTHSPEETIQAIEQDHLDVRQLVHAKLNQAQQLADRAPARSWQLAAQATREIEVSFDPAGLRDLTDRCHELRLRLATTFVLKQPEDQHPPDLIGRIEDAARTDAAHAALAHALKTLRQWIRQPDNPAPTLNALAALDDPFLRSVLSARPELSQQLTAAVSEMAEDPDRAVITADNAPLWIPLLTDTPEAQHVLAASIQDLATTTLIANNRIRDAQELHDRHPARQPRVTASLHIAQNRHLDAYHLLRSIAEDEMADDLIQTIMDQMTNQALDLLKSQRGEQAYRLMMSMPEEFPRTAQYWCIISSILANEQHTERAITAARKATALDPDKKYPWKQLMLVTHRTDDDTRILPVADTVMQKFPQDSVMLASAATRYAHQGKTNRAIAIYHQALDILPDGDRRAGEIHGLIANCHADVFLYPSQDVSYSETRRHHANALESVVRSYTIEPRNTAALAAILRMMEHVFSGQNIDEAAASRMRETIEGLDIKRKAFFHNKEVTDFADAWSDNSGPHRDPHIRKRGDYHIFMSIKDKEHDE